MKLTYLLDLRKLKTGNSMYAGFHYQDKDLHNLSQSENVICIKE